MLTKKELNIFCIWLQVIFLIFASNLSYAVPKSQDRAILEGTETNLLTNPGFEARKSAWTASGSSVFSIETTSPIKGKFSGKWDPSATGEFLDSELIQIESGFVGDRCQMEFKYRWPSGVTGEIKAVLRQFDDSAASEDDVASIELTPTSGDLNSIIQLPMIDCPDDPADSYRFRLESTADAAAITFDIAFMGVGRNTFQLSQTELVAHAFYVGTSNCNWTRSGTSFGDFPTDSDCPAITVVSSNFTVNTTDNNLPDIDFDFLPKGIYLVTVSAQVTNSASSGQFGLRISDGTTNGHQQGVGFNSVSVESNTATFQAAFTYTTGGARNFKIQGAASAGSVILSNTNNQGREMSFTVIRYPLSSAFAITFETVGEHWNVNIGGANPSLGTSNVASYTEIIDASLDLVINTDKGSKSAQIPCSTTNPSTGLTCSSGSEGVGIVINTSTNGRYRACIQFSHASLGDGGGSVLATFQLVETPNNAQTILQEGKVRIPSSSDISGAQASSGIVPHNLCADFIFNSVGQKTIRLMYEQAVSATLSTNDLRADRDASTGQRDINITVDKMDQQFPTPIFPDLIDSLNSKVFSTSDNVRFESVHVAPNCTGSPCTMINPTGGIISVTRSGTGSYAVNLTAFVTAPSCTIGSRFSGGVKYAVGTSITTTAANVSTFNASDVSTDSGFTVHCSGL